MNSAGGAISTKNIDGTSAQTVSLNASGGGTNTVVVGAIGTGNVTPGVVSASFGTSGTIYAHAAKPVVDPQGEIAAFCSPSLPLDMVGEIPIRRRIVEAAE